MKQLIKYSAIVFLFLINRTGFSQETVPVVHEYKYFYAYHFVDSDKVIIDSLKTSDTAKINFNLFHYFPEKKSWNIYEGKSRLRYTSALPDDDGCYFFANIKMQKDSIIITTDKSYSHDSCRGHRDLADVIWNVFEGTVRATYFRSGNRVIIKWNKGKSVLCLEEK